jgi:S1-C subfamily serine protease
MREGKVRRSRLGVLGQTVPMDSRLAKRLGRKTASAVLISDVYEGGPGHSAGFIKRDILLALDGENISSVDDLHSFLTAERANKPMSALVLRRASIEVITIIPPLES